MDAAYKAGEATGKLGEEYLIAANKKIARELGISYEELMKDENKDKTKPFFGIDLSGGSYGSHKETLRFGTGLIGGHWGYKDAFPTSVATAIWTVLPPNSIRISFKRATSRTTPW